MHENLKQEIERLGVLGFQTLANKITTKRGGSIFYKGLARNITSIKSLAGIDKLWIEEGESISRESLKILTPSIRSSAKEGQMPEIWITMNRKSSRDAIALKYLKRAESELAKNGYYEDDILMIVDVHYTDNPWFPEELELERRDDYENLSRAEYRHIWDGHYMDEVENAIIKQEWFDACIDAHLNDRFKSAFKPRGAKVIAHDPSDEGEDPAAYAVRHGSIIENVDELPKVDGNENCDSACDIAIQQGCDVFVYDADGMGALLRKQISTNFHGKKIRTVQYKGSQTPDNPKAEYQPTVSNDRKTKSNADTFFNKRAQYHIKLRDRIFNTYQAVVKGKYIDPNDMISFSSEIEKIDKLRTEVCKIPKVPDGRGLIKIMPKEQMKRLGIPSYNMGDSVIMTLIEPETGDEVLKINFKSAY